MEACRKRKEKGESGFFFCSVSFASLILNMCQAGTNVLKGREGGLQRRRSVLKRAGGGGHLPPGHTHTPTQPFELFVGRSKPLCNNHRV